MLLDSSRSDRCHCFRASKTCACRKKEISFRVNKPPLTANFFGTESSSGFEVGAILPATICAGVLCVTICCFGKFFGKFLLKLFTGVKFPRPLDSPDLPELIKVRKFVE